MSETYSDYNDAKAAIERAERSRATAHKKRIASMATAKQQKAYMQEHNVTREGTPKGDSKGGLKNFKGHF